MPTTSSPYDYLRVERYLRDPLAVRAIDYALSSGLIDRLLAGACALDNLPIATSFGKRLILDVLARTAVIRREQERVLLDENFREILVYRDLLESKIAFADYVANDISEHFADLVDNLPAFMAKSRTFALFRYDRCLHATDDNLAATRRWMRFTTVLTRYEGRVLASLVDLAGVASVLDVGGNSGELARQLCDANPALRVHVADLPVVCRIGRDHVAELVDAGRVAFHACDMRREPLPSPHQVVTLKSVLHDWPAADARAVLGRAVAACAPGGRVVIFERGPMRPEDALSYAQLSNLVFAPFYRDASLYVDALRDLGCRDVAVQTVELEMGFHLIVAHRPGSA